MNVKKLDTAAFGEWVDTCTAAGCVYGVQAKGDRYVFEALEKASDLRLDYDVTILPPKKYLQPQRETLVTFSKESGFKSVVNEESFTLFGIHPYDMIAISQMDQIFTEDNPDVHYLTRRENATLVVCDIQNTSENIFAGAMGTATVDDGFDILVTKIGNDYLVDVRTEKGEVLASSIADAPDASEEALAQRETVQEQNRRDAVKHELKPNLEELPKLLGEAYEHAVWEEKAEQCHSCGSCNLVCPTCYCFNVCDEVDWSLKNVRRERVWDGCMLAGFALTAGGHNFRRNRADRYRHRYLRKGKYIPEKIGETGCVGCGRCITACTTKIANPVEIFNRIAEDSK